MLFGRRTAIRAFAEADRFDVAACNAAEDIGFGGGIHFCIGAPLARLELEAALRALVERAPGLELVAEPERVPAFVIRGFQAVEGRRAGDASPHAVQAIDLERRVLRHAHVRSAPRTRTRRPRRRRDGGRRGRGAHSSRSLSRSSGVYPQLASPLIRPASATS